LRLSLSCNDILLAGRGAVKVLWFIPSRSDGISGHTAAAVAHDSAVAPV